MWTKLLLRIVTVVGPTVAKKISPAVRLEIVKFFVGKRMLWLGTPNKYDDLLIPLFKSVFSITEEEINAIVVNEAGQVM